MGIFFLFALIGLAAYLMYRRGRGPGEQPTVWQDARSLLRYAFKGSKNGPEKSSSPLSNPPSAVGGIPHPARPLYWDRNGHHLEADHSLTDDDRAEEILNLDELWHKSDGAEHEHEPRKDS